MTERTPSTEADPWEGHAPIGSLGNVLELLDQALSRAVTTANTNAPGETGGAGQAMTTWTTTDSIVLARYRLAAIIEAESSLRARLAAEVRDIDLFPSQVHEQGRNVAPMGLVEFRAAVLRVIEGASHD